MSRILYKIFAVAVTISMVIALPAAALPQAASTATRTESSASAMQSIKQAMPASVNPLAQVIEPGGEVELPQALLHKTGPVKVVIELVDEPAAVTYAAGQNKPTAARTTGSSSARTSLWATARTLRSWARSCPMAADAAW